MSDDLWGKPPRKIRDSYLNSNYCDRWHFGPREAGSVLEDAAWSGIVIGALTLELEKFASGNGYAGVGIASGAGAWLMRILLKIAINVLRRNGASWLRDLGAWIWLYFFPDDKEPSRPADAVRPKRPGFFRRLFMRRKKVRRD